ncbi:MAG: PspC domain-containing protein [Chloroflexi bacterium]|nr:PspC domain-containing protein [Chloroflexota bacterium]
MTKKLYRSRTDRMLAGVCGGLADYFGVDPTIVRILMVLFALAGGPGLILYIILMLIIPESPY